MTLLTIILLAACAFAVYTDTTRRRIPNALTLPLAAVVLTIAATAGWRHLAVAIAVFVGVMLLGFLAFSMGWLGGGDVKLAAASAAAFGYPDVVPFLLYTSVGGGVLAVVVSLAQQRFVATMGNVAVALRPFAYKGTVAIAPHEKVALPYAWAIAIGVVAVSLSQGVAPFLRLPL